MSQKYKNFKNLPERFGCNVDLALPIHVVVVDGLLEWAGEWEFLAQPPAVVIGTTLCPPILPLLKQISQWINSIKV